MYLYWYLLYDCMNWCAKDLLCLMLTKVCIGLYEQIPCAGKCGVYCGRCVLRLCFSPSSSCVLLQVRQHNQQPSSYLVHPSKSPVALSSSFLFHSTGFIFSSLWPCKHRINFFFGGLGNGKGCMSRRWVSWRNHVCWGYVHWALSVSWALPLSTSLSSPTSSSCKISTLNMHCWSTLCRERCSTIWNTECLLTFLEALAGY